MDDKELIQYIKDYELSNSKIEKKDIINKFRKIKPEQFQYFIKNGSKANWFTQSEILIEIGYPKVKPVLNSLFEWLKDLNWPGASDIYEKLLLNVDKKELVKSLDIVIHKAYWEGDSQWIYWLGVFTKEANISREDFPQSDNAYDIIMLFDAIYPDGDSRDTWDEAVVAYLELFSSWKYPRISQFIPSILSFLILENPISQVWKMHEEILNLIPKDIYEFKIKEALQKLYELGKINEIGNLRKIIPIGNSSTDFYNYLFH